MENSMAVHQKIKNRITIWTSNPYSGYLPQNFENIYLQWYVHPYIHYSIIHNGPDMETKEVSLGRWLDKEKVVHKYSGILLSHKQRWNTAICDNMNRSWEYPDFLDVFWYLLLIRYPCWKVFVYCQIYMLDVFSFFSATIEISSIWQKLVKSFIYYYTLAIYFINF